MNKKEVLSRFCKRIVETGSFKFRKIFLGAIQIKEKRRIKKWKRKV